MAGSAIIAAAIFSSQLISNGDWIARGDDAANDDWVVRNGTLYTATGMPIASGSSENWGDTILLAIGNAAGSTIVAGNTDNGDPDTDTVAVLDDSVELIREGDGIDLDGNGQLDDDVFLNTIKPQGFLTESGDFYFLATLRDGAGMALGDAFLRVPAGGPAQPEFLRGDANADGTFVGIVDALFVLNYQFNPGSPMPPCMDAADANDDGMFSGITDGVYLLSYQFVTGSPPPPPPGAFTCGPDPTPDALGCDSFPPCP